MSEKLGGIKMNVRRLHGGGVAGAGLIASCLVVVAGARVGPVPGTRPFTRFFGLIGPSDPGAFVALAAGVGVVGLVLCWLVALSQAASWSIRRAWVTAAIWAAPLALGPPLLSSDVYTYIAQGRLAAAGHDPYKVGPAVLGLNRVTSAVDPTWRSVPSPYGPLATVLERLTAGYSPTTALVLLRILAVLSAVTIGLCAVRMVTPARRPLVLLLSAANPLVLLHVVSAAHFEGPLVAATMAALLAHHRGRLHLALALACVAAAIKAPGLVVILVLLCATSRRLPSRLAVVAAAGLVTTVSVPNAWGWVAALETPAYGRTSIAPATLLGDLLHAIIPFAAVPDAAAGGRIAALGFAICVILGLALTTRRRPPAKTVGLSLIVLALLGPVVWPWYLLWGAVPLSVVVHGRQVGWFAAACATGAVLKLIALPPWLLVVVQVLAVVAVLVLVTVRRRPLESPRDLLARAWAEYG